MSDVPRVASSRPPGTPSDPPPAIEVTTDDVLTRALDVALALRRYPVSQSVKGIFLSRFRETLERQWSELVPRLHAPPRLGSYIPFQDYPLHDHGLLLFSVAQLRHPRVPTEEAVRRVGRDDVKVVLGTLMGRVASAAVGSPKDALLALPPLYRRVVTGPRYEAEELGLRSVRLTLVDAHGPWGYQLGQLEGIVEHYGGRPRARLELDDEDRRHFDLSW